MCLLSTLDALLLAGFSGDARDPEAECLVASFPLSSEGVLKNRLAALSRRSASGDRSKDGEKLGTGI